MKSRALRYKPGAFVEITEDINVIPKGVYRLDYCEEESFGFTLGKNTSPYFMVTADAEPLFQILPYSEGKKRQTKKTDFLDRYYELLDESRARGFQGYDPTKPFTMCGIHPNDAREVN